MTEEKNCPGCGKLKSFTEFYPRPNGKPHSACKECFVASKKKRYENNKTNPSFIIKECRGCKKEKQWAEFAIGSAKCIKCNSLKYNQGFKEKAKKRKLELLDGTGCETCDINVPELLDFAHRDRRTKTGGVATMLSRGNKRSQRERDKCRILCAHCHTIETHVENNSFKHIYMTTGVKPGKGIIRWRQKLHVLNFLLERVCEKCGETDVRVLEFDHINPSEKIMEISKMVGVGEYIEDIEKEIAKTRILCRLCHRLHTIAEKRKQMEGNKIKYANVADTMRTLFQIARVKREMFYIRTTEERYCRVSFPFE